MITFKVKFLMNKQLMVLASFVITTSLFSMDKKQCLCEINNLRRQIEIGKIKKAEATIQVSFLKMKLEELENFYNSLQQDGDIKGGIIYYSSKQKYYTNDVTKPKAKL